MSRKSRKVIATSTRYTDPKDVRALLALETFEKARKCGYSVVASDGGSDPSWLLKAIELGVTFLPESDGCTMGAGRREAMRVAAAVAGPDGIVVWMEPEKIDFVRFIEATAKPIMDGRAGLVIPARKSLGSYPPRQQEAEMEGNQIVAELLGAPFDFWFGVMLWSVPAVHHMLDYDGEHGDKWEAIMVPRVRAMGAGVQVVSMTVDYTHPAEQTAQETDAKLFDRKRQVQLDNIVPALRKEVGRLDIRGLYTGINVAV